MEEYRTYPSTRHIWEVSNLGNVRKDGEDYTPCLNTPYFVALVDCKPVRVHNMVGEAFPEICGVKEPGKHLHHLNENQKDNRAVNLRYMSASEHKRLHQQEDGVAVPVIAYNKNGEKVGEYASAHEAARELGCDYRHVSDIVHHRDRRFTHKGYYFFTKDEEPEDIRVAMDWIGNTKYNTAKRPKAPKVEKKAKPNTKIVMSDMNGFQVRTFGSIHSAVDFFGKTYQAVKKSIRTGTKIRYNGVWYKLAEKNIEDFS